MTDFRIIYCTVPDFETAQKISRSLVDKKYAACCNILPNITSVYRWQGKIESDSELLIMIKSGTGRYAEIEKEILRLHPYDVPEIIAAPVVEGNSSYLKWIKESIKDD